MTGASEADRNSKVLTSAERNHSMVDTFGAGPISSSINPDNIGTDFQEIVFRSDPPTELRNTQKKEIAQNQELLKAKGKKNQAVAKIRQKGWTLQTRPKEIQERRRYDKYARKADTLRKTLYDGRLARAINDWHQTNDYEQIERQLNGIKPSEFPAPPRLLEYQLRTRASVAQAFPEARTDITWPLCL
ncbi:hypothetical protein AYL99_12047 [Fonsecaea erecta]|uniref:Uncharacterized protein n=1 Tax=Fonsecaea erecta TaxID=1367422 RepID=A0A178Z3I9_9EURO|nr:hypothetical protein AYL99_12047 [Fonsecaea erecta]OAP53763.1 hypothetical protein AYL99_12047 [Fonsecaea erecta]